MVRKKSEPRKSKKNTTSSKQTGPKSDVRHEPPADKKDFPVVGIGASAGGIEAIQSFLAHMPPDSGMAFVIVQHLAPETKSVMNSILSNYTGMPVMQIKTGMKLKRNHVYCTPPDAEISINNNTFYLKPSETKEGVRFSIDYMFRSLAENSGCNAIGVIFSGTGSDGTQGIKAIKNVGGIVLAQDESDALYDGMPRSAIATGYVDYILPTAEMSERLIGYVCHAFSIPGKKPLIDDAEFKEHLKKILELIYSRTGHDFTGYKHQTIRRRIERRMAMNYIDNLDSYYKFLKAEDDETDCLFRDLVIRVTGFFRDAKVFDLLRKKIIPDLLRERDPFSNIRVWVAGCATGEEAYSLAIVFRETMDRLRKFFNIQIFATDIDEDAIKYARTGLYPASIAAEVSPERLSRFFMQYDNSYRVNNEIRDMLTFAVHSLVKDPPFSKLDIVSCRNLLIYLDRDLQKRILTLFHYATSKDGLLFLGTSESIREHTQFFDIADKKWNIYRRKNVMTSKIDGLNIRASVSKFTTPSTPVIEPKGGRALTLKEIAERMILDKYAPPAVLINEKKDILYFKGKTDSYLELPSGESGFNIMKMVRSALRLDLRTLINKCMKEGKKITSSSLRFMDGDQEMIVDITIDPIHEPESMHGNMMVIFEESSDSGRSISASYKADARKTDPFVIELENSLKAYKEHIETVTEELDRCDAEMLFKGEEMRAMSEELQSTNEELQTSREELQSTNEELLTVNSQLQEKVDELSLANNDLSNLFSASEIGTVFLDTSLCIRRFTKPVTKLFNFMEVDIGRRIEHFTTNLRYENLARDAERVLNRLEPEELEVEGEDGRWYFMRIMPYRTTENIIDGIVITFLDVTGRKKAEIEKTRANKFAHTVLNSISDGISIIDLEKSAIVDCNEAFLKDLKLEKEEVIGKTCSEVLHHEDVIDNCIPAGQICPIESTIFTGKPATSEHLHYRKDGRKIYVEVSSHPIMDENGEINQVVHISRSITDRKKNEEMLQLVFDAMNDAISIHDPEFKIIKANDALAKLLGVKKEELLDARCFKLFHCTDEPIDQCPMKKVMITKKTEHFETYEPHLKRNISIVCTPVLDDKGEVEKVIHVVRDGGEAVDS